MKSGLVLYTTLTSEKYFKNACSIAKAWDNCLLVTDIVERPWAQLFRKISLLQRWTKQFCVQSTWTPHPRGKGKRGYLVIDCTYWAHHPSNPHRSCLGLAEVRGHVRWPPAPRIAPSRSTRKQRRRHRGCPRIPRTHIWRKQNRNNINTKSEDKGWTQQDFSLNSCSLS